MEMLSMFICGFIVGMFAYQIGHRVGFSDGVKSTEDMIYKVMESCRAISMNLTHKDKQ